jgi:hypothetical protein
VVGGERGGACVAEGLLRVQVVERTLTCKEYTGPEDFFFRTIHLGTECWLLVASRSAAHARRLAQAGHWHEAAGRLVQVRLWRPLAYKGSIGRQTSFRHAASPSERLGWSVGL